MSNLPPPPPPSDPSPEPPYEPPHGPGPAGSTPPPPLPPTQQVPVAPPPGPGAPPPSFGQPIPGQAPFGRPVEVHPTPAPSGGSGLGRKVGFLPLWAWIVATLAVIGGIGLAVTMGGDDEDADRPVISVEDSDPDATEPEDTDPDATDPEDTDPDATDAPEDTSSVPPETDEDTVPETDPTEVPATASPLTLPVVTTAPTVDATTTTTADAGVNGQLAITEQWVYPSGDNIFDYGGIVENPGTEGLSGFIEIEITFFDDTDRIISTESAYLYEVLPGTRTPFTSVLYEPASPPARMEAKLADDNFTDPVSGPFGSITIANVALANEESFSFDVVGEATSTFTEDRELVLLTAIWRDANGAVTYSATEYLDRVPAGSVTVFSITVFSESVPRTPPTEILYSL